MQVDTTALDGVLILRPRRFGDDRGFFMESYNQAVFNQATGLDIDFIQDNHSRSVKGVLRGLHYQLAPNAQSKLVRCISGTIFDVAVDIRRTSPTFGQWVCEYLSADNNKQLWVPAGFAHGFLTTSSTAEVIYKVDAPYAPDCERSIRWDDQQLGIQWPDVGNQPTLSSKDSAAAQFAIADVFE